MLVSVTAYSSEIQQPVRATAALGKHPRTRQAGPSDREQRRAGSLHPDGRPTVQLPSRPRAMPGALPNSAVLDQDGALRAPGRALAPASGLGEAPAGACRPYCREASDQPGSLGTHSELARCRLPRRTIVQLAGAASRPPWRASLRDGFASLDPAPTRKVPATAGRTDRSRFRNRRRGPLGTRCHPDPQTATSSRVRATVLYGAFSGFFSA